MWSVMPSIWLMQQPPGQIPASRYCIKKKGKLTCICERLDWLNRSFFPFIFSKASKDPWVWWALFLTRQSLVHQITLILSPVLRATLICTGFNGVTLDLCWCVVESRMWPHDNFLVETENATFDELQQSSRVPPQLSFPDRSRGHLATSIYI